MKENYNLLLKKELELLKGQEKTPSILLHSCCAPCSTHVITCLTNHFNITILYYNPNIAPQEEYLKRKNEQIKLLKVLKTTNKLNFLDCDYDNSLYEKEIKGLEFEKERGKRCTICFRLRLEKTAKLAKLHNFDYFGTTLTVSPYKNHLLINKIGKELATLHQIKWLPSDFKKENGYKNSIELSKKHNLYRQDYCGCLYSKREREELFKQHSNPHKATNNQE